MKNRIVALSVASVMGLISADAFASVARQAVMLQGDPLGILDQYHGSFYYEDNYNIFYNPSYANDFKNWAAVEKDNVEGNAEGGFVASAMNFNIGLFMNREVAMRDALFGGTPADGNLRPIDLIIAADMGVKWGLGITYGSVKQAGNDNDASQFSLRAGAQINGLEPFAEALISAKDETSGAENSLSGFTVGTRYKFGEWIPYAVFQTGTLDPAVGDDQDASAFGLGLARNMTMSETVRFNYAFGFFRQTSQNQNVIPIQFSIEAELLSWLVGRAGFGYNFWNQAGGNSLADSTVARLGASFLWDKVSLDWAIGGGGGTPAYGSVDSQSFDFSNGLFSYASLNYRW